MKIIKKAKILPAECESCGTVFIARKKDLLYGGLLTIGDPYAKCPFCGRCVDISFEKKEESHEKNSCI